uniref:CD59 glycoprotein n=1 Tax=Podarcis muralis TaxID=64176 RepID=A0A670HWE0_PODMU
QGTHSSPAFNKISLCISGYALRCYTCEQSPFLCRTNLTCSYEEDACLQIRFGMYNICWKMSQCTTEQVANYFNADSFRFLCCQRDLCNKSLNTMVSTVPLAISAMTGIWMMFL